MSIIVPLLWVVAYEWCCRRKSSVHPVMATPPHQQVLGCTHVQPKDLQVHVLSGDKPTWCNLFWLIAFYCKLIVHQLANTFRQFMMISTTRFKMWTIKVLAWKQLIMNKTNNEAGKCLFRIVILVVVNGANMGFLFGPKNRKCGKFGHGCGLSTRGQCNTFCLQLNLVFEEGFFCCCSLFNDDLSILSISTVFFNI